jgi:DNA-binding transcriptional regulator LsrR (DeoR family)
MAKIPETESNGLDDAARAGWLYYIAGNTQDEIASKLGISRQSAQRLVSLAVSKGLIKVRLDHPIADCLDLSRRLKERYRLKVCEVVPAWRRCNLFLSARSNSALQNKNVFLYRQADNI